MNIDLNKVANQRKRSSLRQNNLFNELCDPKDFQEWIDRQKRKSVKWDTQVEESVAHQCPGSSSIKLKEAEPIISTDDDQNSDIYLCKLTTVNKIEPTKEILEEIVELVEEGEANKEMINNQAEITSETTVSDYEEKRRLSIKDEFTIAKEFLKMNIDDELEPEVIEETMKNTLYNKVVGKLENGEFEQCGEDSDDEKR